MAFDGYGRTELQVVDQAVESDLEQRQTALLGKRRQNISQVLIQPAESAFEPGASFYEKYVVRRKLADVRPHEDLHLRSHAVPDEFLRVARENVAQIFW